MSQRSLNMLGVTIGGTLGAFMPGLWGAGDLSGWSILTTMLGGLLGLFAAIKLSS